MNESLPVFENLFQEDIYLIREKAVVVMNKAWVDLTPEEITLLSRILGSVKLSLAGVRFVSRYSFSAEQAGTFFADRILLFGCEAPATFTPYTVVRVGDVSVICADSLDQLDDGRKKALWTALKQMFAV